DSMMQYSPIRTPGPIDASGATRAVGAMMADGSIPDTLGDAAVAILDAVVLIDGRNGAQPLVVQALLTEDFFQVRFERVQALEMVRSRRDFDAARRAKKLLIAAIDKDADLATDQHAGAVFDANVALGFAQIDRKISAARTHGPTVEGC